MAAYADIVREKSVQRQLIAEATDIADSAYNPGSRDVPELLDLLRAKCLPSRKQPPSDGGPEVI